MESPKIEKTCCFTGHRNLSNNEDEIKSKTKSLIIKSIIQNGYTHFICGGAIGFDTIAAEIIIELKKEFSITLEIAIPCKNQNKYWSAEQNILIF